MSPQLHPAGQSRKPGRRSRRGATVAVTAGPSTTTPASGCVVLGGLGSGPYEISTAKGSFVDEQGKSPPAALTGISLEPSTAVTEEKFTIAEPATLNVTFEGNGAGAESNSFYALNTAMKSPSDFVEHSAAPVSKLTFAKPSRSRAAATGCSPANANPTTPKRSPRRLKNSKIPPIARR